MTKKQYQMAFPYFPPSEIDGILAQFKDILLGEAMLSQGHKVKAFEFAFAEYCGVQYAVATNSCSAALEIALRSIGVETGDEVIVPVETFIATGAAVVREGAKLIFANIDPQTFCLSLQEVKRLCTKRTKAIIIVHMAGLVTPDIIAIKEYCDANGIWLIEDAAHAPGAAIAGQKAGSIGHIGCFSFYPTKVITTAEGGMLTTNDKNIYDLANSYRHRGRDLSAPVEQYNKLGTNNRMTEFSAIMGLSQLKYLDEFVAKRNQVARFYRKYLMPQIQKGSITPLPLPSNAVHAYWRYIVKLSPDVNRDTFQAKLRECGVPVDWAYHPPLHLQPVFATISMLQQDELEKSVILMRHFVCLPMHSMLEESDVAYIVNSVMQAVESDVA